MECDSFVYFIRKNVRTELRRNFFSNRVVEQWNSLPSEVKMAKNVKIFKHEMEKLVR